MKHKHYDAIIAWANGAEIQRQYPDFWDFIKTPQWYEDHVYRIKPAAKPSPQKMEEYLNALLFVCNLNNTNDTTAMKESILLALKPKEET